MFAWTVGVPLVLLLLLIWSVLVREGASRNIEAERRAGRPARSRATQSLDDGSEYGAPRSDGPGSDGPCSDEPGSGEHASGVPKTHALPEAGAPDSATSGAGISARHAAGK